MICLSHINNVLPCTRCETIERVAERLAQLNEKDFKLLVDFITVIWEKAVDPQESLFKET